MTQKEKGLHVEHVDPYDHTRPKGEQVEQMFDSIAPAYDLMNTAMTFGLHRRWRDTALRAVLRRQPEHVLDVATGTGDLAFRIKELSPKTEVTGIDLSEGMLAQARKKLKSHPQWRDSVTFQWADCLSLPFADDTFDAVTVAYGVRNFQQLESGYREMYRVLRPGGELCVIELSVPRQALLKAGYDLYSRLLIPSVGRLVSGDSRAYTYLPESIAACPQRDAMTAIMRRAGFRSAAWRSLTFGVVTVYLARK